MQMISYLSSGLYRILIPGWSEMQIVVQDERMASCTKCSSTPMIAPGHSSCGPLLNDLYHKCHRYIVKMSCLSISQDRELEARMFVAIVASSRVEVGLCYM